MWSPMRAWNYANGHTGSLRRQRNPRSTPILRDVQGELFLTTNRLRQLLSTKQSPALTPLWKFMFSSVLLRMSVLIPLALAVSSLPYAVAHDNVVLFQAGETSPPTIDQKSQSIGVDYCGGE